MSKKRRISSAEPSRPRPRHEHPLKIQPYGNLLLDNATNSIRSRQLGQFAVLPDELILELLHILEPRDLRVLGYTSRVFAAFATHDDLWKQLFVRRGKAPRKWFGTWRATYYESDQALDFDCAGLYSDALFRPFVCSSIDLTYLRARKGEIPKLTECPSQSEFDSYWAMRPFILKTDILKNSVDMSAIEAEYADTQFIQECVSWRLDVYCQYMRANKDESPLYLFDKEFAQKTKIEYEVPDIFAKDYFDLLDARPDYRWLIMGPERSGSTFHKDPNATSAWNAVLQGEKYWVLFPPDVLPPGVFTSEDESEVTSPLSIAEWLLEFHKPAMKTPGYIDGFCSAGEVMYVPSGWWHLVVNTRPSLAITQNFVPLPHVTSVLRFLQDKKDQISGFHTNSDVYADFVERLKHTDVQLAIETKWSKLTDAKNDAFEFGFESD